MACMIYFARCINIIFNSFLASYNLENKIHTRHLLSHIIILCQQVHLLTFDTWLSIVMATHFPPLCYQFDKFVETFYKVLDVGFWVYLLE